MANEIPASSRYALKRRDLGQCVRCGSSRGFDWHHRRRRGVKGGHYQHCACNGISLCRTCHGWVHDNPYQAQQGGFIVSAYEEKPGTVPVKAFYGVAYLQCDGGVVFQERQTSDTEGEQ